MRSDFSLNIIILDEINEAGLKTFVPEESNKIALNNTQYHTPHLTFILLIELLYCSVRETQQSTKIR